MDKLSENSETCCCPRFDPEPWDEKEKTWDGKLFLKDRVRTVFHIPIGFGKVMTKNMSKITGAEALSDTPLMLCDEDSMWSKDIYIAVGKDVPDAQMERIYGTFLTKVFEGPYKNCGNWAKEMTEYVKAKGKEIKKMYFSYTTCPACAKYYGKNYVILFAQI
jgi:hypothetical protein